LRLDSELKDSFSLGGVLFRLEKSEEFEMNTDHDVYQLITDRIIDRLTHGVVPWRRPWNNAGLPKNLVTKREYRGVNVFLLSSLGYESPWWLTWNQLKQFGGNVRKGEKACPVVFWKWYEKEARESDEDDELIVERRALLRHNAEYRIMPSRVALPGFCLLKVIPSDI